MLYTLICSLTLSQYLSVEYVKFRVQYPYKTPISIMNVHLRLDFQDYKREELATNQPYLKVYLCT